MIYRAEIGGFWFGWVNLELSEPLDFHMKIFLFPTFRNTFATSLPWEFKPNTANNFVQFIAQRMYHYFIICLDFKQIGKDIFCLNDSVIKLQTSTKLTTK